MSQASKYRCVHEHDNYKRGDTITAEQYAKANQEHWVKVLENSELDKLKSDREKMVHDKTTITK